jgi:hypothetical protein
LKVVGGRASEHQLFWRDAVNANGGYAAIAHGLDEALRILECWQLIKPARGVSSS